MIRKQGKKFCAFERKGIATLAKFQDEPNFFFQRKRMEFSSGVMHAFSRKMRRGILGRPHEQHAAGLLTRGDCSSKQTVRCRGKVKVLKSLIIQT